MSPEARTRLVLYLKTMGTFSQSFGEALGPAIGGIVVYLLLALFALLAAAVLFGGIFLALAIFFYKKKKKKTFFVFGILSDLFLSLLLSLIANGVMDGNGGTLLAAWAVFFVVGLFLTIGFYRRQNRS